MTSLYDLTVTHIRTDPLRNAFTYGGYCWFVDVDHLPRLPRGLRFLAGFRAGDHLGDSSRSIRENLDGYLAGEGIDLDGGQILMLTQARVAGYVFNPLSVFWCHYPDGTPACVVAEVHNTYGEAHRYLLRTDERGRARTGKRFYVSPFYPVDGEYRMSLPLPGDSLDLTIALHRETGRPFVASVRGRRIEATTGALLRIVARHPLAPLVAAGRIRVQGIRLWRRGLPVLPRPQPAGDPVRIPSKQAHDKRVSREGAQ